MSRSGNPPVKEQVSRSTKVQKNQGKYRTTLPADLCNLLGIKAGDEINWHAEHGDEHFTGLPLETDPDTTTE